MKLGLVGLPMSGKTTIFNALTGQDRPASVGSPGKLDVQIAVVDVPDITLDRLTDMFNPKSKVHVKITYADIGGLAKGISEGGLTGPFRNQLAQMEGFLHVIRVFDDENVPHPEVTIDAQRDLDILDSEFMLTDLVTVENRIGKLEEEIKRGKDRATNQKEHDLFMRMKEWLEDSNPLLTLELNEVERESLRGYTFMTMKPKLVLLNMGEELRPAEDVLNLAGKQIPVLPIQGKLEMEIAQLEPEEAQMFMDEYGISQPMRERVIRKSFDLMHIQTFYTVGEDECRAWTTDIGATAQQSAGRIHSDLERGFIRAEIIPAQTLLELGGYTEAKSVGKLRLEGREYVMADGDIMNVRHNA
jgi:ribosome-binding ATPase